MNSIYYACAHNNNFGDLFNKWLAEKLTGHEFVWGDDKRVMICGSTLQDIEKDTHVFGLGFGALYQRTSGGIIHTLRGHYTKIAMQSLGWMPDSNYIGSFDPMQILPEFIESKQGSGLGLIRHYVDCAQEQTAIDEISVCSGVDSVIDFINQHDAIITSSLHALIAADVLGKKTLLVSFGDRIATDGFKYLDYFSVSGYIPYKPLYIEDVNVIVPEMAQSHSIARIKGETVRKYTESLTNLLNQ